MPINPLGVKNRKGTLGSYYAVRDYLAINPDLERCRISKPLLKKRTTWE